jgi:hypothetical protein
MLTKYLVKNFWEWNHLRDIGVNESTGLFKQKYTLSKMYFTKTTDTKSMSCVRMERKSLSSDLNLRQAPGAHTIFLSAKGSYVQCGKSWIINLTSATSHVGLTSSACKVWK